MITETNDVYSPWTPDSWIGDLAQCQAVDAYAREYAWDSTISDPEFAADVVLGGLGDLHPEAYQRLRAGLIASAQQCSLCEAEILTAEQLAYLIGGDVQVVS